MNQKTDLPDYIAENVNLHRLQRSTAVNFVHAMDEKFLRDNNLMGDVIIRCNICGKHNGHYIGCERSHN